jgi:hypothetical protein
MKQNEKKYSDEELINQIKQGGNSADIAIRWFYKEKFYFFFNIRKKISKHWVSDDELLDAYHDAIIELKNKVLREDFVLKVGSPLSALFYFVFYCNAIDIQRRNSRLPQFANDPELLLSLLKDTNGLSEEALLYQTLYQCAANALQEMEKEENTKQNTKQNYRCSDLLRLRKDTNLGNLFLDEKEFKEIAQLFNFTSETNARVAFFNCKQKFIKLLKTCFTQKGL